jgi:hypothetical protein
MAVILKDTGVKETNSKYGYVIEMFDTVEDFKCYIREELLNIRRNLKLDDMEDRELNNLIEKNLTNFNFSVLWSKYTEYNFSCQFEIM